MIGNFQQFEKFTFPFSYVWKCVGFAVCIFKFYTRIVGDVSFGDATKNHLFGLSCFLYYLNFQNNFTYYFISGVISLWFGVLFVKTNQIMY